MSQQYAAEDRRGRAYPFHPVKIAGAALLGLGALFTGLMGGMSKLGAPIIQLNPAVIQGSSVTSPVSLNAQGTPNGEYTLFVNGQDKGKVIIGNDSTYNQPLELPAGAATVQLKSATSPVVGSNILNLNVAASATPPVTGSILPVITDPVMLANGFLPNAPFDLKGRGNPGEVLEVFDGAVSLGKVTVAPDGTWSLTIVPSSAGDHDYTVTNAAGTSQILTLNFAEKGKTGPACPCKLRISMSNPKTLEAIVSLSQDQKNLGDKLGTGSNWPELPAGDYSYTVNLKGFGSFTGKANLPKNRSISVYLNPQK